MQRAAWIIGCGLLAALVAVQAARAGETVFPDDVGLADVKAKYGAKGDGATDDTAAIQKALDENIGGIAFLPNGTYLISDTLKYPGRQSNSTIWGQSTDGAVLKLKDNCPGFTDPRRPKAMIWTGTKPAQRFKNYVRNLTFDTGRGNPGAIGAQFIANNTGAFREVTLRCGDARGPIGLDLGYTDEQGPCLIKNVKVIGFDVGISCRHAVDSITFENITMEGQRVAGLQNDGQCVSIRGVVSSNSVPAIVNNGVMALLDSKLTGKGEAAIVNSKGGHLFARNIQTAGYAGAIANQAGTGKGAGAGKVEESVSHPILSVFPSPQHSLNLEIKETPDVEWGDPAAWVSVAKFGAVPSAGRPGGGGGPAPGGARPAGTRPGGGSGNKGAGRGGPTPAPTVLKAPRPDAGGDTGQPPAQPDASRASPGDATEAVQQAIDSGARTLYFPKGQYTIDGTVHIRGKVQRIIGLGQEATLRGSGHFQLDDDAAGPPVVVIENLQGLAKGFLQNSKRTIVLRNMAVQALGGLNTTDGFVSQSSGDVFLEDVVSSILRFSGGGRIWARQLNTERQGTHILNDGCTLWILGLKTERGGTLVHTRSGQTEICGGFGYTTTLEEGAPEFIVENASVSITFGETNFSPNHGSFDPVVREIRGGQTRDLRPADCPKRTGGSVLTLFVGYPAR
jgi:hypothetical protein